MSAATSTLSELARWQPAADRPDPIAHREHIYWRHFRDWKGAVQLERLDAHGLDLYGRLCAITLAKAHARSGDRGLRHGLRRPIRVG